MLPGTPNRLPTRATATTSRAAAVRDDAEDIDQFTPDAAFSALRNNHMSLTGGRRAREGREAMGALRAARRQRTRGTGAGFGDRHRALEIVVATQEILAGCPKVWGTHSVRV